MTNVRLEHVNYTVTDSAAVLIDLQLFDCTLTRLGGAHMLHFNPKLQENYTWMMDKLGTWVDPLDVVNKGSQYQHAVRTGVYYGPKSAWVAGDPSSAIGTALNVLPIDAPVVNPATPSQPSQIFQQPFAPLKGPITGFSSQLFQNAFSTNTPQFQWDHNYRFRYKLSLPTH